MKINKIVLTSWLVVAALWFFSLGSILTFGLDQYSKVTLALICTLTLTNLVLALCTFKSVTHDE